MIIPRGQHGGATGVEYLIPSAFSPVQKAGKYVFPLLGTMKAEELSKDHQL